MQSDDVSYLDIVDLAAHMRAKMISPVEVVERQISRIGRLDGRLRSFALMLPESAREQACQAEAEIQRGEIRGPLHGVPIGVKDACWVKGAPTTGGMPIYRDFRPAEDSTVVRKLREAGAIVIGLLRMTEGAYADYHPSIAPTVNPWHPDHWVGTSSSGPGAAVAAGLVYGAIGSDTGGSIRFPCAANGLTGLKPTWGRVSRHGLFEMAATLDHLGPMTRSAKDAAAILGAIAGPDDKDPTASRRPVPDYLAGLRGGGLKGMRLGVDAGWNEHGVDEDTRRVVAEAAALTRRLGAEIRTVRVPDPTRVIENWELLCGVEASVAHEKTYPARKAEYGPTLARLLDIGRALSGMDYQKIVLERITFSSRLQALFEDVDLLLTPVQATAAPTLAQMKKMGSDEEFTIGMHRYTAPFNMSGNPTIVLPGGSTQAGMSIGFQLVAGHHAEGVLLRMGHAFQQNSDWHRRRPPVTEPSPG
jgi:amidase